MILYNSNCVKYNATLRQNPIQLSASCVTFSAPLPAMSTLMHCRCPSGFPDTHPSPLSCPYTCHAISSTSVSLAALSSAYLCLALHHVSHHPPVCSLGCPPACYRCPACPALLPSPCPRPQVMMTTYLATITTDPLFLLCPVTCLYLITSPSSSSSRLHHQAHGAVITS